MLGAPAQRLRRAHIGPEKLTPAELQALRYQNLMTLYRRALDTGAEEATGKLAEWLRTYDAQPIDRN